MENRKLKFVHLVKNRYTFWVLAFLLIMGFVTAIFTDNVNRLPLATALGTGIFLIFIYRMAVFYADALIADQRFIENARRVTAKMMEQDI